VAGRTRKDIESQSDKKIISNEKYLETSENQQRIDDSKNKK
jgi:hypothetical protein